MSQSQYKFEVVRDVATVLGQMYPGESAVITVRAKTGGLYDWDTSWFNEPCGPSEAAQAMGLAYDSVFRDVSESDPG